MFRGDDFDLNTRTNELWSSLNGIADSKKEISLFTYVRITIYPLLLSFWIKYNIVSHTCYIGIAYLGGCDFDQILLQKTNVFVHQYKQNKNIKCYGL